MNIIKQYLERLVAFVASTKFLKVIIGLLVVQAFWIALSGRFALAFDEDFHFGVIKLYSEHLYPFWSSHPASGDAYGAVARDPSYLYHYIMSFPYRLIRVVTHSETAEVLILRFINIAMFASCLPLFKRLLSKTHASPFAVNLSLLIFVLIPIVPLLAAQINYDNLILPLLALALIYAAELIELLKRSAFSLSLLLKLVIVALICSLIKYASLPALLGTAIVILVVLIRSPLTIGQLVSQLEEQWTVWASARKWGILALLLVLSLLFAERYGFNIVRYHTPVPDCAQVLSFDRCKHYGPWIRDYNFEQTKSAAADRSPLRYTQHWLYGMWFRSVFAVDGPRSDYETRGPLTIPAYTAAVAAALGTISFIISAKRLWRRYDSSVLYLLSVVTVVYVSVLWLTEYQLYLQTGMAVAINGRYLLPLMPFFILLSGLAVRCLPKMTFLRTTAVGLLVVLGFAYGGGALTYILRSSDSWYFSHTPLKTVNHAVKRTLGPVILGQNNPTQFLH
ncbi:MAG: hypothetical protein QFB86_00400 [Patescibacteria group bacterium]|nr:hypothetical protein [Patescibacteria group bacterium]